MKNKINYKKTKKRIKGGSAPPPPPGPVPNLLSKVPPVPAPAPSLLSKVSPPGPGPNLSSRVSFRPPPGPGLNLSSGVSFRTPSVPDPPPPAPAAPPNLITNKTKKVNTTRLNFNKRSKNAEERKKAFLESGVTINEIEKIYKNSNIENDMKILKNIINNEIVSSKAPIKKISFKGLGDVNFINPKVSDLEINSIEKPDNRKKLLLIGPSKVIMEIKYKLSKSSYDMFNYEKITITFIYNSLGYDEDLKCEIVNIESIIFNDNQPSRLTARDLKKILNKEFICNIFKNAFANIKNYLLKDVDNKLNNLIKKQGANIPETKCQKLSGLELRKCQQNYDKTMFDKKMERIASNTSLEKIFRLYLGVFYGETPRIKEWKKYKSGKFFLFDLDEKILNTLLDLHPNFDIEKHKLESEKKKRLGFRLIQDAINNKVRGIPYQEQINKMTFFEHFVFVLCSKRSFVSGKIRSAERRGREGKGKKEKLKGVSKFDIISSDASQLESIKTSKAKAEMFKFQKGGMASAFKYALDTKVKKFAGLKGDRAYGKSMSKKEIDKLKESGVFQDSSKEYKSLPETKLSKLGKRLLGEECDSIDDDNERLKCCNKVDTLIKSLESKKRNSDEEEKLKQLKKDYDDYKTRCISSIKDKEIRNKGCSKIGNSNKKVLCNNMFITNDQERRMGCDGIINDEVLKMRCIQGHTQKAMAYKRKNLDVLQVERIFRDKFRKIMTASFADKKGKCIGLNLEKVCCSNSKNESKKRMCRDAQEILNQQDPNTEKSKCESLKNSLDQLYCYKDLYDETGREKFKGMVKFLCRKKFCVKGLEDDVCLEFNTCKDIRPRFRDIFRDSRDIYKEIKELLELGDIKKSFGSLRLPSRQSIQQYFRNKFSSSGSKEQTLVLKELIKFKKGEKKLLEKQYNLFKKTEDGKKYAGLQKQKKKTQKKSKSSDMKGLLKKFISQKSKNKFVKKAKNNKNKAESNEKELNSFVEKICSEAPGERCDLAKKAKEYEDIDDSIKMLEFVIKQGINESAKKMNKKKSVQDLSKEKPLQSEASKATKSKNTKKANAPKTKISSKITNIQSKLKL